MTLEELKEILNNSKVQYQQKLTVLIDYLKQKEVYISVLNKLIKHGLENRHFTYQQMQIIFRKEVKEIVHGTSICKTETNLVDLSNMLYFTLHFNVNLINQLRRGKLVEESVHPKEQQERIEKTKEALFKEEVKQAELEALEKKRQRQIKQAAIMREAKARKRKEARKK